MTPETRRIFGHADDIHTQRFNNELHTAILEDNGTVICEGFAYLQSSRHSINISKYMVEVIGQGKAWAVYAANHTLSELTGIGMLLNGSDIVTAWNSMSAVQMFPVQRGDFTDYNGDIKTQMSLTDFHPFFHLKTIFSKIFEAAGYGVSSSFFASNLDDVYFSGKAIEQSKKEDTIGFKAGRESSMTVAGNTTSNEVGLVDTADESVNDDFYNNGGSFLYDGITPKFTPSEPCCAQFLLKMPFMTELKVSLAPTWGEVYINYVNSVTFGGITKTFTVVPDILTYEDKVSGEDIYKKLNIGSQAPILGIKITLGGYVSTPQPLRIRIYPSISWGTPLDTYYYPYESLGQELIYLSDLEDYSEIYLVFQYYDTVSETWVSLDSLPFTNTYVIRHYVSEYTFTCEILSRHPVYVTESYNFATFSLGLLNSNGIPDVTIGADTTIEAQFSTLSLGLLGSVTPLTGLLYDETQAEFLKAVKHLFNLRFLTDEQAKIVYIEPRSTFSDGAIIDWSGKIDLSQDIEVEELGQNLGKKFILKYLDDDENVQSYNEENTELGSYSAEILHQFADDEDYESQNEFFNASLSGPSLFNTNVKFLKVDNDGNFSARLVRYTGLKSFSNGNMWPSTIQYPCISFYDSAENVNLGFDALHTYYDININSYNLSRRVTAYLFLKPKDIEGFARLTYRKRDFRGLYSLTIDGEKSVYMIESITDYNPNKSTKCTFIKCI
jgi:hypothetical protein